MMRVPIVVIVDDHSRIAMVAQRTPTIVVSPMIPGNPGRAPAAGWDPVPAHAKAPRPSSIMMDTPAPRIVGYPGPATHRIPHPASIVIGAPSAVIHIWDPDIAIGLFINPATVVSQLSLIFIQLFRQIGVGIRAIVVGIPSAVPFVKTAAVAGIGS